MSQREREGFRRQSPTEGDPPTVLAPPQATALAVSEAKPQALGEAKRYPEGQQTLLGVYRWLVLSLTAYLLAHWTHLHAAGGAIPDWGEAAQSALELLLPLMALLPLLADIQRLRPLAKHHGLNINVSWCKIRGNDTSDPNTLLTDYWFALSYDGGTTWRESHVAGPFDMRIAPLTDTGYFVGDYEGLTHIGALFEVMFVQANSGNTNNRTDVFSTLKYNGDVVYTANSTLPSGGSTNSGPQKFGPEPLR